MTMKESHSTLTNLNGCGKSEKQWSSQTLKLFLKVRCSESQCINRLLKLDQPLKKSFHSWIKLSIKLRKTKRWKRKYRPNRDLIEECLHQKMMANGTQNRGFGLCDLKFKRSISSTKSTKSVWAKCIKSII